MSRQPVKFFLVLITFSLSLNSFGQDEIDSLTKLIQASNNPTEKADLMYELSRVQDDDSVELAIETLIAAERLYPANELEKKADATYRIGGLYAHLDELTKGGTFYLKAATQYKTAKNDTLVAYMYTKAGRTFYDQSIYDSAMFYYMKAKDLYDSKKIFDDHHGVLYHYIGSVHKRQDEMDKACEWYNDEYKYGVQHNLLDIQAEASYLLCSCVETTEEEMMLQRRALKIYRELGNERKVGLMYSNMSGDYMDLGMEDSALYYMEQAVEIYRRQSSNSSLAARIARLADIHRILDNHSKALELLEEAEVLASDITTKKYLRLKDIYSTYYRVYQDQGNYKDALGYYKLAIVYRDSASNEEHYNTILEMDAKYETAQRDAEIAAQKAELGIQNAEIAKKEAEHENEVLFRYVLFGGLGVAVILILIVFNRFQITRKQKAIIEDQKHEVEIQREILAVKNQEITDSINYAKRIQSAILPPDEQIQKLLPNSFILYKPKDIVAGDFYWMHHNKNTDEVFIAAADCTGHGVPGAMVSVICNGGLNRSVREFGLNDTGSILDKTREIVVEEFEKGTEAVNDGMDIALCRVNKMEGGKMKVQFSGANNPLWVIRKDDILVEIYNADRQPIGKFDDPQPYSNQEVELFPGDSFYIFTDGFVDQFGGDKGKKLKAASFKKLLVSASKESMDKQKETIDNAFVEWQGSLEQVDDVCVIGVRV